MISLKFSLHKVAADLAFEATYLFLSDIRSTVGDDIFAKFLNLNSDESMALVIDVSGSMSGESFAIKLLKEKKMGGWGSTGGGGDLRVRYEMM